MSKNAARINAGIRALTSQPYEIISGTVVTVDTSAYTVTVQPPGDGAPIEEVRLSAITGFGDGLVLLPKADSNVIIGSVDGPGEWVLIRASEITNATLKIGHVVYEMDESNIRVQNNNVLLNVGNSVFKMNTAGESLFQLLQDLITYTSALTVSTSTGPSGPPLNISDFNSLLSRLTNLLSN